MRNAGKQRARGRVGAGSRDTTQTPALTSSAATRLQARAISLSPGREEAGESVHPYKAPPVWPHVWQAEGHLPPHTHVMNAVINTHINSYYSN